MEEFFLGLQFWHWLVFGSILIIIEVFAPSAIFLWPGAAAIVIGLVNLAVPELTWMYLLSGWAVLSVILAAGWQSYKKSKGGDAPTSTINRRGEQYVGRHFTLTKDIVNGTGELHVDDTRWKIVSAYDVSAGAKVKVTAVEGTSLRVEEFVS